MTPVDSLQAALERIAGPLASARPRFDVEPVPLVAPATIEQVAELLRFAERDRLRVIPFGLGSKLGWCGVPGHVDFMLSTRNLRRVVSHVPDDGTVTVEAGMTMAELERRCRDGGHFLTPDVAAPAAKTIGGVVAAGESGFDRLRFGPVRHHVLGTRVVLADGTLAKSGGQLVKNVTGFDLHRLYCGSHGTLAVIVEVSLRLFPEPERELMVVTPAATQEEALDLARRALAAPTRVVSVSLARIDPPQARAAWTVIARLFGKRAAVEAELALFAELWPGHAPVEEARARPAFEALRDELSFSGSDQPCVHVSCRPSKLAAVLSELTRRLEAAGAAQRVVVQPGTAEIDVELRASDAGTLATLAARTRAALAHHGATLSLRNAAREVLLDFDPFGAPSAGLDLMRAIQRKLDPSGVFSTGRFHGGL